MLRVIHSQSQLSKIVIDDIDDGMPNKTAHRQGSSGDPKAYKRDGYANEPKQPSYLSYAKPADPSVAGYIDLKETQRVLLSSGKGKIRKLVDAGLCSVVSFTASDLAAPTLTTAIQATSGDLTLTGTNFLSVSPETTSVLITGTGAVTLTQTDILDGGGTISNTSIVIPAALVPGLADPGTSVQVKADAQTSATILMVAQPTLATAVLDSPGVGDLTLTGTNFLSHAPAETSVILTGTGAVTLTADDIVTGGGTVTNTSIVILAALIPGIATGTTSAQVEADGLLTGVVAVSLFP